MEQAREFIFEVEEDNILRKWRGGHEIGIQDI